MQQPPRILIGMPTTEYIHFEFANSLIGIIGHAKTQGYYVETYFQVGVRTDRNRNDMVKIFMEKNMDYLLFLDTDMTYPADLITTYLQANKPLIGGVYFKRSKPHFPVVFKLNEAGNFQSIDTAYLPKNQVVQVDGLGTGGMWIARSVFEDIGKSGQDYWFNYGTNYHIPGATENIATHDLVFCKKYLDTGGKIYVHTGVEFEHITSERVNAASWEKDKQEIKDSHVTIIIPAYGVDAQEKLRMALESIERETEYEKYVVEVVVDGDAELFNAIKDWEYKNTKISLNQDNIGYPSIVNMVIGRAEGNLFVYLAQDVVVGRQWLTQAVGSYKQVFPNLDGLVTFSDGKWHGEIASHGLVHRKFIELYCGQNLFYPGYRHYNCDRELTEVAKMNGKLAFAYKSVAFHNQAKVGRAEADLSVKHAHRFVESDNRLFTERRDIGFPKH